MKVIIIGGVAGGASCAARLRRVDEEANLLVATEQMFRAVYKVDARTSCEVVGIDSQQKTVELKNQINGETSTESYDKLVLSPGAAPIRPPLPGIDTPRASCCKTDSRSKTSREACWPGHTWLNRFTGKDLICRSS